MLYELDIGGDFDDSTEIEFDLRQFIEASSCEEAVAKLYDMAPAGAKVLWVRDSDKNVLLYDNDEDIGYQFAIDREEFREIFEGARLDWPDRIDVTDKSWSKDGTGCLVPGLTTVKDNLESKCNQSSHDGTISENSELVGLAHWLMFKILHSRAKQADVYIVPGKVTFSEVERVVIEDYLGWSHDRPS